MTAQLGMCGDVAVLVPAAGTGSRLGPGAPKALRTLRGDSLLVHAVRGVLAAHDIGCVVVAAPRVEVEAVRDMLSPVLGRAPGTELIVVPGGRRRQESVALALAATPPTFDIVLVHDAARALTPPQLIDRVAVAVRGGCDAVIPVLPVVDTIKQVDGVGSVLGTVDRTSLRVVQTPQGFRRSVLTAAHESVADEHTDDAGMAEKLGIPVRTVPGEERAWKITRPLDLALAELLLAEVPR